MTHVSIVVWIAGRALRLKSSSSLSRLDFVAWLQVGTPHAPRISYSFLSPLYLRRDQNHPQCWHASPKWRHDVVSLSSPLIFAQLPLPPLHPSRKLRRGNVCQRFRRPIAILVPTVGRAIKSAIAFFAKLFEVNHLPWSFMKMIYASAFWIRTPWVMGTLLLSPNATFHLWQ